MSAGESAGRLSIGWAGRDVTPDRPVMLRGQFSMRISQFVRDPLTVTALALDSGGESCVMVSVDHVTVPGAYLSGVRAKLAELAPDLVPEKVFISATHTHTGPQMLSPDSPDVSIAWEDPGPDVMSPQEYADLLIGHTAECVAEAWRGRKPGALAWGLGYAVVGRNRRQVKSDGTAVMYGDTSTADFSHIEGTEDHSVQFLFTYDAGGDLTGMLVNLACPSQVTESHSFVSADFWHEARCELRRRHGDRLFVLPQCSAAGDQSPHVMFDKRAEARMLRLKGRFDKDADLRLGERIEIAARIADAADDVLPAASRDIRGAAELAHVVRTIELPRRRVTEADVREARKQIALYTKRLEGELADRPPRDRERSFCVGRRAWYSLVPKRYELQKTQPTYPMELHVVRVGDIVFATNPFELFLDFGIRMKARSRALQTFVVQLAGPGSYLPSARAVAGKSYGSEPASNVVGPEAGDLVVEETLKDIAALFPE
ncbi:MAG: hypothetical protein GXP31_02930 [Kiritimatiellaeota bacterium]|nr:hypothetical protein [Kiritimatiellota bacterium]